MTDWLTKEAKTTLVRNELLLKLFFGGNIAIKDNIHHLRHAQKSVAQEIEIFHEIRERLIREHKKSPQLKYWLITLDFGLKTAEAQLNWCKDAIKILESE